MNVHEYQAKQLLARFGVPVSPGGVAFTAEEALSVAKSLPGPAYVVKSQIHAGGRGKGRFVGLAPEAKGGVRVLSSVADVRTHAEEMLGRVLVTQQTGAQGKQVQRVYIENGCNIEHEYYLSMLVDRATGWVSVIASTEGGVDIEEVAHKTPEKILTVGVDPATGFQPYHGRKIAHALRLKDALAAECFDIVSKLYTAFVSTDAALLEVNPFVVTKEGHLHVLDAKMSFDSNALYRHPDVYALRDETEEDPAEIEASKYDLAYIKLDGNIGCMVNGAGLAMASLDIIKLSGGEPANFLDVGGGASKEKVQAAFKIILSDPNVRGILVNIFGGIMRCDIIAEGVVAAARELALTVPLVVRLEGTNVDLGKKILADSGLKIIPADDLGDAARKIVAEVKKSS